MKLLCLALLVFLGHQALTKPRRMKRQPFILKPVPAENMKVNLEMTKRNPEASTVNLVVTTKKPLVFEPRQENVTTEKPLIFEPRQENVTTEKPLIFEPRHEKAAPAIMNHLTRCKKGEFLCDGDLCVADEKRCDGRVNCKDGTDEDKCYQVKNIIDSPEMDSRQECGAVYNQSSGTIKHPSGEGNYHNNENCPWTINAGEPIRITFTTFNVETNYDFLMIREGSGVIAELTGHTLPEPVETRGNSANLQFTSDYSVNYTGFELHWAPSGCGEVFTTSNGVIKHPMKSVNYENKQDCVWLINAAEPIKITIVRFDLEENYDFLYVRNGPDRNSALLGSSTGSTIPSPVQTTQNSAYIRFSSDHSVTKTGFELRWEPVSTTGSSDCACGQVNRASRIVNGVETEVNEYPWQAGLVVSGSSQVFCGGSVIGSKHVLTAAHCTEGVTDNGLTPQNIQVLVGAHHLSSPASSERRLGVARFIQHPSWNDPRQDNDISILELSTSIDFGSTEIRPVCLPDNDDSTYDSVTATVSGWGRLVSGGSQPEVLMEVDVPTMTNAKCAGVYGSIITDNMLCAGFDEGGKDSCQGDSGGPLFYNPGSGYTQIGVVSFGAGCAEPGRPGVYARVTEYLSWISTHTASGTTCSAAKRLPP